MTQGGKITHSITIKNNKLSLGNHEHSMKTIGLQTDSKLKRQEIKINKTQIKNREDFS